MIANTDFLGVPKEEFLDALQFINDQARLVDQKLSLKIDHEIEKRYSHQKHELNKVKSVYRNIQRLEVSTYQVNERKLS